MDNVEPAYMPYKLLTEITDSFSHERIVGDGSFGVVYKGEDKDAQVIAVKILRFFPGVNDDDFHREFNNLAKLRHENIVQLLGFCNETEPVVVEHNGEQVRAVEVRRALCFEYMQNGSLHKHLHDADHGFGWNKRYRIIKGICEGLKYLHMRSRPVYHLDLKPENILLDDNMVPKIADFGLSRLLGEENTTKATISAVGTRGYLPPEYINYQIISKEFDIFSLGVIVIKIMMGSAGYSLISDMEPDQFLEHVCSKWRERLQVVGWRYTLLIPQVKKCIEIALKCIETDKNKRPTIQSIVEQLNETERHTNHSPSWMEESDDRESVPPKRNNPARRYQGNQRTLERSLKSKIPPASDNQNPDGGPLRRDVDENSDGGTSRENNENLDGSATNTNHTTLCSSRISQREVNFDETPYDLADRRTISNYIRGDKKPALVSTLPKQLSLEFLKDITNGFSPDRKLIGQGAFGTVYKGFLHDGQAIAVKKVSDNSPVAPEKHFKREVRNLMAVQHENIVRLYGYCHEAQKKVIEHNGRDIIVDVVESMLCYEYAPKGNLDKCIFDMASRPPWATCFKIIKGICQGLHFLHKGTDRPIVHLDLQPANILLDDNMVPKIADFGLSRLFGEGQTRINTINVVGAKGYMAPEYQYRGEISTRSDIYSLGILIMEITTGQKNSMNDKDLSGRDFVDQARQTWTDEHIASKYLSLDADSLQQVKTCIEIGLECVDIDQKKRPSIVEIVDKLYGRPPLHRINMVSKGVTIGSVTTKLLDICPAQILFPLKPNKLMSRSLELTNRTDEFVAIRLLTKCPKNYMAKMPLCGILPPRSAYTLIVTRSAQKQQSPPNSNIDILTLESSIVGEIDVGLNNGNPDIMFSNFFKEAKEVAANKVYEETSLKVVAGPSDARTSAQFLQSEIEVISDRKFPHVLSIDLHLTEPWILTGHHGGDVVIWDYQAQEIVNSFDFAQKPVYSVKFIERKQWLIAGDGDGIIYVYNCKTNEEITTIEHHEGYITSLAVHPTDPLVLSSSDDQLIILWDWEMDWTSTTFEGHSGRVTQVIFNPMDTDSFVSASLDHTIKVWNVSSAECKMTLRDQSNGLLSVHSYTIDNRQYLITGSWDGTAQVWDLEAEKCVRTFKGHVNDLSCVFVHPSLPIVITGFRDGTVRLWNQRYNQEEREEVEEDGGLGLVRMEEENFDESEEGVHAEDDGRGVEDKEEAAAEEEVQEEEDRPLLHVSSAPSTIWDTHRLENIIGMNLGAVYAFGYIESSKRIVVGCHQGIAIVQINSIQRPS